MNFFFCHAIAATKYTSLAMAQPTPGSAAFHKAQLERHCRVCAKKLLQKKYTHSCSANEEDLKVFGIDVTHDSPEIHPTMFCHTCRNKAQRGKKKWVDSTLEVHDWGSMCYLHPFHGSGKGRSTYKSNEESRKAEQK